MTAKYKRILLKLSGEALAGEQKFGIDVPTLRNIANEIFDIYEMGVEIGIVVGGGNYFRGEALSQEGMDRSTADHMGMLATVMNCLGIQEVLESRHSIPTRVLTAISLRNIAEPYILRRALRHFEQKRIVIFGAGTGNPYFSTDTAASLRALEIHADIIMKATKVDGVFDKDPEAHKDAKLYSKITFLDAISQGLKVMDSTALSLCMDHNLPIQVFNLSHKGNVKRAVMGESIGTIVRRD